MLFNKDMKIFDIVMIDRRTVELFKKHGMECTICNGCHKDTLEVACKLNSVSLDELLEELNNLDKIKKVGI